jgi:hypothetical protein
MQSVSSSARAVIGRIKPIDISAAEKNKTLCPLTMNDLLEALLRFGPEEQCTCRQAHGCEAGR